MLMKFALLIHLPSLEPLFRPQLLLKHKLETIMLLACKATFHYRVVRYFTGIYFVLNEGYLINVHRHKSAWSYLESANLLNRAGMLLNIENRTVNIPIYPIHSSFVSFI